MAEYGLYHRHGRHEVDQMKFKRALFKLSRHNQKFKWNLIILKWNKWKLWCQRYLKQANNLIGCVDDIISKMVLAAWTAFGKYPNAEFFFCHYRELQFRTQILIYTDYWNELSSYQKYPHFKLAFHVYVFPYVGKICFLLKCNAAHRFSFIYGSYTETHIIPFQTERTWIYLT